MVTRGFNRIISIVLVLAVAISSAPIVVVADDTVIVSGICGESLTWTLNDKGILTISGTGTMDDYGFEGTLWYSNREAIKTVVIEDVVTSIGFGAFRGCSSLTDIETPDSVTNIGRYVFWGCSNLTNIPAAWALAV